MPCAIANDEELCAICYMLTVLTYIAHDEAHPEEEDSTEHAESAWHEDPGEGPQCLPAVWAVTWSCGRRVLGWEITRVRLSEV